ncbi:hypothetical protein AVEN_252637-1 [Araneus ventricosus]|uniref:Uncharacterized protein n=1 Tax=Araneus ventricosus TaxID=182803 RepID=A0A4Y2W3W3_ARAVE|nr:hypothetical protein AVEN_252637-1 [Araneus ventricosus]
MRLGLPSTAVVGDRFGVSDRDVAAIASSVLHDIGLITSNNSDLVVDTNKLRRENAEDKENPLSPSKTTMTSGTVRIQSLPSFIPNPYGGAMLRKKTDAVGVNSITLNERSWKFHSHTLGRFGRPPSFA